MKLLLVGQPFGGKTTLFSKVIGYRSYASTVVGSVGTAVSGHTTLDGTALELVDLPGIYSLEGNDPATRPLLDLLLDPSPDVVIVHVVDASVLSRSLELTLQLLDLGRPLVVALNMVDEAARKGVRVHPSTLAARLGVPVVGTVASRGDGVYQLFQAALEAGRQHALPPVPPTSRAVDRAVQRVGRLLVDHPVPPGWTPRLLALRWLEQDPVAGLVLAAAVPGDGAAVLAALRQEVEAQEGKPTATLVAEMRHALAFEIFEAAASVSSDQRPDVKQQIDNVILHPVWGYAFLGAFLYLCFNAIYGFGNLVEPLFLDLVVQVSGVLAAWVGGGTLAYALLHGVVHGIGGGIGIVVPYLLPFFVILSLLEDTGYLARMAYLIDRVMHRVGLHGTSVLPVILGYGCSVPGVCATRVLRSARDKLITATLVTLVPCSARMTVIFGLVGFFISVKAAGVIYLINLVVVALTARVMAALLPDASPGVVPEIPRYHRPHWVPLVAKTWFRVQDFVVVAWPLLIVGSAVMETVNYYQWDGAINAALAPFTAGLLGLPRALGVTLVFGMLRKELALILLFSALGTQQVMGAMTEVQLFTFTLFVTFYLPCLATFTVLRRELGLPRALGVSGLTIVLAVVVALGTRVVVPLLG